jgi:hypothetical protein
VSVTASKLCSCSDSSFDVTARAPGRRTGRSIGLVYSSG